MLFLFNTAVTHDYARNILNTLALPNGYTNVYEYETFRVNYIEKDSLEAEIGEDVIVVFIDRFEDSPEKNRYIPLRYGKLNRKVTNDDPQKVFFYVELADFIKAETTYNDTIKRIFAGKLFHDKVEEGEKSEAGFLSLRYTKEDAAALFKKNTSKHAWREIITVLENTTRVQSAWFVFSYLTVFNSKGEEIKPKIKEKKDSFFLLKQNEGYEIHFSFYNPAYINDIKKCQTPLLFRPHFNPTIEFFTNKDYLGTREGTLILSVPKQSNNFVQFNYSLESIEKNDQSSEGESIPLYSDNKIMIKKKKKWWSFLPYLLFALVMFFSSAFSFLKDQFYPSNGQGLSSISEALKILFSSFSGIALAGFSVLEALLLKWIDKNKEV